MSAPAARIIRTRQSTRHLPDLLQSIFAAELVCPSRWLWLVSPWVSDIPILDNSAGQFMTLAPEWDRSPIRLSHVLFYLAERATKVHVATSYHTHNTPFLETMREVKRLIPEQIYLHQAGELHEKGMLGDGYYLSGSFNFTFNGITLNEEVAHFLVDEAVVSESRQALRTRWPERDE